MFKKEKTFILLMFVILIATACSGDSTDDVDGGNGTSNGDQAPIVTEAGEFPIVEEEVELTILTAANPLVEDFATNEFTKEYEELTGVKINWEVLPAEGATEQLNLILTSGEYPDVIMGMSIEPAQLALYGENGTFLSLNDMIEEYGVETKRMFEMMPIVEQNQTTPNGNIYALPQVNECYHCTMPQKMWVYEPWLDELGLDIPETTEEYRELLLAIKNEDPNNNGEADEIPLAAQQGGWHSNLAFESSYLIDPFIYSDMHVVNGEVVVPWDKPEYKEALAYMHDLYQDGLIYSGSFTMNAEQYKELGENPDNPILGTGMAATPGSFADPSGRMNDYVVIPPLEGPDGQRATFYLPNPVTNASEFIITSNAEHPEVAFRFADALYDEELTMRSVIGIEGVDWQEAEEGAIGLNGEQAVYESINLAETTHNRYWDQTGPSLRTSEFRSGRAVPEGHQEIALWTATEQYEPYISDTIEPMPQLYFSEDQANDLARIEQSLEDYVEEMTAAFITGSSDIDAGWDNYLATLEQIGIEQYVEMYQNAYDELD